jgi:hypothetical protein
MNDFFKNAFGGLSDIAKTGVGIYSDIKNAGKQTNADAAKLNAQASTSNTLAKWLPWGLGIGSGLLLLIGLTLLLRGGKKA